MVIFNCHLSGRKAAYISHYSMLGKLICFSQCYRETYTHLEGFQTSNPFLPKTENWCIASFCLFFNWKGQSCLKLRGVKDACQPTHTLSLPVSQPSSAVKPRSPEESKEAQGRPGRKLRAGWRHTAWSLLDQWLHTVPSASHSSFWLFCSFTIQVWFAVGETECLVLLFSSVSPVLKCYSKMKRSFFRTVVTD